jgi:hypothetical protein
MIVGRRRNADTTRFCNALKPRRNIHVIPKDVMWLDNHVADIDADTECNKGVSGVGGCEFFDAGLKLHSRSNRSDRTWKLCQEPVAGILDDAAAVFGDRRRYNIGEKSCQFSVCGLFIKVHHPRIACHIGGHYR